MSTDWKALAAELAAELERCRPLAEVPDCLARVRAALTADGPAVQSREPASVVGEPSDEELLALVPQGSESDFYLPQGLPSNWVDGDFIAPPEAVVAFARAALARYGRQSAPPAEGEVGELVAWLRDAAFDLNGSDPAKSMLTRAADLLEQRHPTPVPMAERLPGASHVYFEFVISDADDCTQAGGIAPTYAQALSEGQHYLAQYQQDGPHTLELRRVEVLPPGALPLPQGEVG